jgi:hypothetical protein
MKITPLIFYPTTKTYNSHRLPLHNSGALPAVNGLFKWPSYKMAAKNVLYHKTSSFKTHYGQNFAKFKGCSKVGQEIGTLGVSAV